MPNSAESISPYLNVNNLINKEKITIDIKITVLNKTYCSDFILKKFEMVLNNIESGADSGFDNIESGGDSGFDNIDKKGIRVVKVKSSIEPVIINKIMNNQNFFNLLAIINLIISKNEKKVDKFKFFLRKFIFIYFSLFVIVLIQQLKRYIYKDLLKKILPNHQILREEIKFIPTNV